jgi:GntR family transcriptional regulator
MVRLSTPTTTPAESRRLIIRLESRSTIPRFEQLRAQISVMVAVGRLEPNSRLPTVRELAEQLSLAPGTVARAYRELEQDGTIATRGRAGTFVAAEPPQSEPLREQRERIASAADRAVFELRQLGLDPSETVQAINAAITRNQTGDQTG